MNTTISRLTQLPAHVTMPAIILRLEGLALFVSALVAYGYLGYSWWMFALLVLAPTWARWATYIASGPAPSHITWCTPRACHSCSA